MGFVKLKSAFSRLPSNNTRSIVKLHPQEKKNSRAYISLGGVVYWQFVSNYRASKQISEEISPRSRACSSLETFPVHPFAISFFISWHSELPVNKIVYSAATSDTVIYNFVHLPRKKLTTYSRYEKECLKNVK